MDVPVKPALRWIATGFHFVALFCFCVGVEILFFGGFRFFLWGMSVSATQLRNPILLSLTFTVLGKLADTSLPLREAYLFRLFRGVKALAHRFTEFQSRPTAFWGGLIFLNILVFLPGFLLQTRNSTLIPIPPLDGPRGWYDALLYFVRRENQDVFRLSADLYGLVVALFLTDRTRWRKKIRGLAVGLYCALLIYQTYEALSLKIFGERPLFYSDLLLLKDGAYLVLDVWSWKLFDAVLRIVLAVVGIILAIRYAFGAISHQLRRLRASMPMVIAGVVMGLFISFSTFWYSLWYGFENDRPTVQWVVPKAFQNLRESVRGYRALKQLDEESPNYDSYREIRLNSGPNIYLFMIESYGKILADRVEFRDPYGRLMQRVQAALAEKGWFSATNFSTVGISGGKSWLSTATILSGINVDSQPIYQFMIHRRSNYPHLVRFMNRQGYRTFALQPPMRKRPGFTYEPYQKYYDFDTWIYFDDLKYTGELYGWGMVPDQYSLNFTHEEYLKETQAPYFLLFTTVTSHAPWYELPPFPEDWEKLNDPALKESEHTRFKFLDDVWPRTKRRLVAHLKRQLGLKDIFRIQNYFSQMRYQMEVMVDYIVNRCPDNSIVLIVGDHQPPVITQKGDGFETPIHIISKHSGFIRSLQTYGFAPGMIKDPESQGFIRHEAIFSMLVRTLVQHYGDVGEESLPPYRPEGLPLSALRN